MKGHDLLAAGTVAIAEQTTPRIGFGTLQLVGHDGYGEPADRVSIVRLVRRAVDEGVRFIDTADAYGPHVAEVLLRAALTPYPDDLIIATKGGMRRDKHGGWLHDGSPRWLVRACEGSLRRLGVDAIGLYQLHAPDPEVPFEDSIGTLADLQSRGLIRSIGLSNVSAEQLELARHIVPVASVQNGYNVLSRRGDDVIDACERDGIVFIPWFPLGAGFAARRGGLLQIVAREIGATRAQVALSWLLKRSRSTMLIPGTRSLEHLEENLGVAAVELDDATYERIDRWSVKLAEALGRRHDVDEAVGGRRTEAPPSSQVGC